MACEVCGGQTGMTGCENRFEDDSTPCYRQGYEIQKGRAEELEGEVARLRADKADMEKERGEVNLALRTELVEVERLTTGLRKALINAGVGVLRVAGSTTYCCPGCARNLTTGKHYKQYVWAPLHELVSYGVSGAD